MTKMKILIVTLSIIVISGLFYTSYSATRKSTKEDPNYNKIWVNLEEYADGTLDSMGFDIANSEVIYAKKWIQFFEIQDLKKDKLEEKYRKECIEIIGKLRTNPNIVASSEGKDLLSRISKIELYVIETWDLTEAEIRVLNPELLKEDQEENKRTESKLYGRNYTKRRRKRKDHKHKSQ